MPGETDAYRYEANGDNLRAENAYEIAGSNMVSKKSGQNFKKLIVIGSILFLGMLVGLVVSSVMLSKIQSQAMNEIEGIKEEMEKKIQTLNSSNRAIETGIDGIKTDNEKKFRNLNSSVQELKTGIKEGQKDNERKFQYFNSSAQYFKTEMKEGQKDNERKIQYLNSSAQNFKTDIMRNILGNAANTESICYMGVKSRAVPNSAFSASSVACSTCEPYLGRLDNHESKSSIGAWCTKTNRVGEWIQVDFGSPMDIAGIVTQGDPRKPYPQFVTSYKISCGSSKDRMGFVTENGSTKVFTANVDQESKVYKKMPRIIKCRYVKIYPQTYHKHMCMRIEFVDGKCFDFFQL